jgi:hypothetical protein
MAQASPLLTFTSHIQGKNAKVEIYPDRIEWFRNRSVVAGVTAASLTMGVSLLKTGIPGGKRGTEMIPVKSITGVNTKRDGMLNTIVSVITSGDTINFRVSHAEATKVRDVLNHLVLAGPAGTVITQPAPMAVAPDMASQIQQLAALRDQGILTDDEFTAKKTDFLSRI